MLSGLLRVLVTALCLRMCAGTTWSVAGQGLTEWPENIPADVTNIDMSNNAFTVIPADAFSHTTGLEELVMQAAGVEIIQEDAFTGLTQLTDLNLRANLISGRFVLPYLARLRTLDISYNPVDICEVCDPLFLDNEFFNSVPLLEEFIAQYTSLIVLPPLNPSNYLWHVAVSNNEFTHISRDFIAAMHGRPGAQDGIVYVTENPINCNEMCWALTDNPNTAMRLEFQCDEQDWSEVITTEFCQCEYIF